MAVSEPCLAAHEREVLDNLRHQVGWVRPMDVGGKDASHHSRTLAKLVRLGLAERRRRAGWTRPSYLYRAAERAAQAGKG